MLLSRLKVSGHSMEPNILNGQLVIASSLPFVFAKPKSGDIIVFAKKNKLIVKRLASVNKKKYEVLGDNKNDSLKFDPIKREDILGKVIFKF